MDDKWDVSACHSLPNEPAKEDPTAAVAVNTPPKRSKRVAGFWIGNFQNDHLSTDGLQRAKKAIQEAVLR